MDSSKIVESTIFQVRNAPSGVVSKIKFHQIASPYVFLYCQLCLLSKGKMGHFVDNPP